jgi:hypothetical protein
MAVTGLLLPTRPAIQHVKAAAEQLPKLERWRALLHYICQRIIGQIGLPIPPPTLAAPG